MINDSQKISLDDGENNKNKIIENNEIKNTEILKNNENKNIDIKKDDDINIHSNNNINNEDIQNKNIVEEIENQNNDIKTDNKINENINNIINEDNENVTDIKNDENKINIIKNDDNIITYESTNMEVCEEEIIKLFDIIFLQKVFNAKKTKINLQTDYEFIIHIINKLKENEFELFFIYLNEIKISIFKIIVNGFIEFTFNDENKEKNILDIISRMISLFYNKNFFYFIYKKLSKFFIESVIK